MIELSKYDKMWIKMCKMHYRDKYPLTGSWVNTLKPLFEETYGWDPDTDYHTYCNVLFEKLFDIFMRIKDDHSGSNRQLKEILSSAFYKGISRTEEQPIERAISCLCGLIQSNLVTESINEIQQDRYSLELVE